MAPSLRKRYTSQLFAAESTTAAIQHLSEFHKIERPSGSVADDDDIDTTNASEAFQLVMPFNEDEYKQKLIDWAIKLHLSYREVTDASTIDLLTEYVAVCAHFVDGNGHPRTLLLGFPRRHGGHTGGDLAALVKPVILQYGIGDKLGSFVMDNADDNDKCLEVHFYSAKESARGRKNLIEASEEQRIALWSIKGVVGKLHNFVTYVNRNDARRELLKARMRITKTSDGNLFVGVLLNDGGIRWNATYYMIERALKCRPAIDLYQAQWKPPDRNDKHKNDFRRRLARA
ncbi:hypothetical protein ACCO45_010040 [Purpureocillium lilacinum]|uniref:Uncharacterized protein n=1 Tax=Purpureocillium lilacinum TaxID=33203 RepID=A0ACC4DEG8_PURLI